MNGRTRVEKKGYIYFLLFLFQLIALTANSQTIIIDGNAGGKRFDGIGAVSGGGATSVLLKDYPNPQRGQILDLLFKPNFGASISALLVEVPGDGNSTQGSEPSHMHVKGDENYYRGYEWWLMAEAKKRNPNLTLDANGWSAPAWIGNGNFWSQDMCDYYVKWITGLKKVHGLTLDAIGCRNESGVNTDFIKMFRKTLNNQGLGTIKLHAFDNWGDKKFDFVKDLKTDPELRDALDVISVHTLSEIPTPKEVLDIANQFNKPIWNSEEHIYKTGFDCEISLVASFNKNFIESGATKIINWYLAGSTYTIEPFAETPAMLIAREPWSGHYYTREVLWGYAHYGQFSRAGWQYLNGACGKLTDGGTYVTLKSPGSDYSVIIETQGAKKQQTLSFKTLNGLSAGSLCVWRSNAKEQFIEQQHITPVNGAFTITVEPESIYSISTTSGQQKGAFKIPAAKAFPFPYFETFDEYTDPRKNGYLPKYTADIAGIFEIAERSDKKGKCLRQVLTEKPQSWAPEWLPYTIIGNPAWKNYQIAADVYIENEGWAGIMGRVTATGAGYGCRASGYYLKASTGGNLNLYVVTDKDKGAAAPMGTLLASATVKNFTANKWHTLTLRFEDKKITGLLDNKKVFTVVNTVFLNGMAGLITGEDKTKRYNVQFDNLSIKPLGQTIAKPAAFSKNVNFLYK